MHLTLIDIKEKFKKITSSDYILPASQAHNLMSVPGRGQYPVVPEQAKKAAVLITFYERHGKLFIAFIRRVEHEQDRHSGQIGFPGGKMEENDNYPIQTALRETYEEIGLGEHVEVIGHLSGLYIPVSGFYVSPVIAIHHTSPTFKMEEKEVSEILEIDIDLLFKEENKSNTIITYKNTFVIRDVPCYNIQGTIIWGATAMILAELEWVLKE